MPKDVKFSALVDYFRKIAVKHRDIRHTDADKHFYRFEVDEVLSGISGMNYPAMIMEGYRFSFADQKSDNPVKKREGAFILIDHVGDPGDYEKIHQVWDHMEEIGDDILARIKADKKDPASPVRDFDIESVNGQLVATELGNHYGIRYTFSVDCRFTWDVNPEKWMP
ncbi:MAG: hypothetical protein FD166_1456 [Bacteroidetes bacterium]|nr:MAG: hypothetical protein FD166_1456 [Bacteroidota bacterium]